MTTLTHCSPYTLFKLLRQHRHLAERRDPMFEANKAAKWVVGFSMAMVLFYLIMLAVVFALAANASERYTSIEYLMGLSPFILLVDFWVRFIAQQTPSQIIKPYVLLPLPRYACIDSFVITSLFNWANLTWYIALAPYCLMSVVFSYGFWASVSVLLLFYLIILTSSQLYSIVRTLTTQHYAWWLLPVAMTLGILSPWLLGKFKTLFAFYAHLGSGIEQGNLLPHLVALLVLMLVIAVNRRLQYRNVMAELGRAEEATTTTRVIRYSFLERYGILGEYLKLEVKLLSRNKNPRKQLITATVAVIAISAIVLFSDVYDNDFMTNFWCIYNLVIYAATLLLKVMSYEGNYIDVLMVHRENTLRLLTAKYYFFCIILLVPMILTLPMVIMGKWQLLMLVSYAVYTAGFQHFMIMQAAVYNNKAMPLNEKFIGKGGVENNYVQIAEGIAAFFVPMLILQILQAFLPHTAAWLIMMAIGLAFVATHPLWLRHIYRRMMARRYQNLEAFHS